MAALVQTARLAWEQTARAWNTRARARQASVGEANAEALLLREGFEILARHIVGKWAVDADGEQTAVPLQADLLLTRGGRRYVAQMAEAGTPRPDAATTRRALLEFRVAFGVDGLLRVDADAGRVSVTELASLDVAVDEARSRALAVWFPVFAFGVAAGALLVFFTK